MADQGSQLIDIQHFKNMTAAVNGCQSCDELKAIVADAFSTINSVKAGIQMELDSIAPILALLTPPSANPAAIVTYLTSLITNLVTPMVKPNITYALQLTEIAKQISDLTAAISTVSVKFPNCSVSIPGTPG